MIPFIVALTFSILLTLVFAIPGIILCIRWFAILISDSDIGVGEMKIPTFYVAEPGGIGYELAYFLCMPVVGSVFGGIHCIGWFFDFPSSAEAMLWRVSSATLTGIAFLFPMLIPFLGSLTNRDFLFGVFTPILLVYVVSRLFLLVEAFISLRHLTPGMLALVKWTSFIPHI